MTKIGGAIGERVQSVTAATAPVAGHSQAADVAAPTTAAAGRADRCGFDACETAQQARSQAGTVAENVVLTHVIARPVPSRQVDKQPLMTILVGFVLVCIAGFWIHRWSGRPRRVADDKVSAKALRHKRSSIRVPKRRLQ